MKNIVNDTLACFNWQKLVLRLQEILFHMVSVTVRPKAKNLARVENWTKWLKIHINSIGGEEANFLSNFTISRYFHQCVEWRIFELQRQLAYEKCSKFIGECNFLT